MSFSRIEITVNTDTKQIVRDASVTGVTSQPKTKPVLNYNEINVLCISFVDSTATAYPLEADDEFILSLDSERRNVTNTDDLMAYSDNSQVDIAGDWADISRANGKISIRIDSSRDLFESRITETDGGQECYLDVVLEPNGTDNWSMCLQDLFECTKNVISRYQVEA